MTLFDIKELASEKVVYITDVKWDYLSCLNLKNDEITKKIKIVKMGGYDEYIKVTIDFSKFMKENETLFNKLFKTIYTVEAQKDLKACKKDIDYSEDDIEEYLIFVCQVIDEMIEYDQTS